METKLFSPTAKLNLLNELLNLEFHLDYYSKKDKDGRLTSIMTLPQGESLGDDWVYTEGLDFWNFDISINDYKITDVVSNDERISYISRLTDIYSSLVEEIKNEIDKNSDPKVNKLFLLSIKNNLELFLGRYYKIRILESGGYNKSLDGIWHNAVVLIPNDVKKHLPDIAFIKYVISIFLKQQKQIIETLISWINGIIQLTAESTNINISESTTMKTGLQWKKSDTDLLELIVALNESGSIFCNNSAMSRKQTIEYFENLFEITIKDPESKLSRATERKKDPAPYLTFLRQTFENYSKRKVD